LGKYGGVWEKMRIKKAREEGRPKREKGKIKKYHLLKHNSDRKRI